MADYGDKFRSVTPCPDCGGINVTGDGHCIDCDGTPLTWPTEPDDYDPYWRSQHEWRL